MNHREEPLRQDLFTAQIETLAELRVAFSRFLCACRSSDKLRSLQRSPHHFGKENHPLLRRVRFVFSFTVFYRCFQLLQDFLKNPST